MMLEPWIETYTGKQLHFLEPQVDEIDIIDIAHALANECRFGGHTSDFYSVAEHSLLVATILADSFPLEGLLHDASEAYLRDIASPIKQYLSNYKELEAGLMKAIAKKFDLDEGFHETPLIKQADVMALKCEARQLLPSKGKDWLHLYPTPEEINTKLHCFAPKQAKELFLRTFRQLTGTASAIYMPPEKEIVLAR